MKLLISTLLFLLLTSCNTACKINLGEYCLTVGASIEVTQEVLNESSTT